MRAPFSQRSSVGLAAPFGIPIVVAAVWLGLTTHVPAAKATPRWVRLSWTQAPSTTLTVAWTDQVDGASQAEIRPIGGTATGLSGTATDTGDSTLGVTYSATFAGLVPYTDYEYRVQSDGTWSQWYATRTAPSPGSCAPLRFVSVGDGRGEEIPVLGYTPSLQWPGVMSLIATEHPLFVIHSGDYVYDGFIADQWDSELADLMTLSTGSPFLLSLGNHDDGPGEGATANFNNLFVYPTDNPDTTEDYYSLVMGNVQVICLSTQTYNIEDQIAWMDAELTAYQGIVDWRVVFFHVPIWSSGAHGSNEDDTPRASVMLPVLESQGVDLVINGHDHDYERFHPSIGGYGGVARVVTPLPYDSGTRGQATGVTYIVTGGAGALVNPIFSTTVAGSAFGSNHIHYLVLEANGGTLQVTARDLGTQGLGGPTLQGDLDHIQLEKPNPVCTPEFPPDAGVPDAGLPDSGTPVADGAPPQADGAPPAADAAQEADAGSPPGAKEGGCNCQETGGVPTLPVWCTIFFIALWFRRVRQP